MTDDTTGPLSDADVRHIIGLMEALERSQFDSLQLDAGKLKLTLGKGGTMPAIPAAPVVSPAQVVPVPLTAPVRTIAVQSASTSAKASASDVAGLISVRAPIMGLFYSRPDPASSPFVSIGSEVSETTTVGLIEVMKVFNAVQAGANGTIIEICVQDAETIEIGQTLFLIRPTNVT